MQQIKADSLRKAQVCDRDGKLLGFILAVREDATTGFATAARLRLDEGVRAQVRGLRQKSVNLDLQLIASAAGAGGLALTKGVDELARDWVGPRPRIAPARAAAPASLPATSAAAARSSPTSLPRSPSTTTTPEQ